MHAALLDLNYIIKTGYEKYYRTANKVRFYPFRDHLLEFCCNFRCPMIKQNIFAAWEECN